MRGHTSQNIWKICGNSRSLEKQIILKSGGNDETAKLWDIDYHLNNNAAPGLIQKDARSSNIQLSSESVDNDLNRGQFLMLTVPEDIIINCPSNESLKLLSQQSCDEPFGDIKKKSRNKQIGQVICGMKFYPEGFYLLLERVCFFLLTSNLQFEIGFQTPNRSFDWLLHDNSYV